MSSSSCDDSSNGVGDSSPSSDCNHDPGLVGFKELKRYTGLDFRTILALKGYQLRYIRQRLISECDEDRKKFSSCALVVLSYLENRQLDFELLNDESSYCSYSSIFSLNTVALFAQIENEKIAAKLELLIDESSHNSSITSGKCYDSSSSSSSSSSLLPAVMDSSISSASSLVGITPDYHNNKLSEHRILGSFINIPIVSDKNMKRKNQQHDMTGGRRKRGKQADQQ